MPKLPYVLCRHLRYAEEKCLVLLPEGPLPFVLLQHLEQVDARQTKFPRYLKKKKKLSASPEGPPQDFVPSPIMVPQSVS